MTKLLTLHNGALHGGRWIFSGAGIELRVSEDVTNILRGVTVVGDMRVGTDRARGELRIDSGLTIEGSLTGSDRDVTIWFDGTQSITGGRLVLNGGLFRITGQTDATLTITPSSEIYATNGGLGADGPATYTLDNQGLIRTIDRLSLRVDRLVNSGTIRTEGSARSLSIYAFLTTDDLTNIFTPNAVFFLAGTLINTDRVLTLTQEQRPELSLGGEIVGGTVDVPGDTSFTISGTDARLTSVTINGDVLIDSVQVSGYLQMNGTATLWGRNSSPDTLVLEGTQTLQSGTFVFGGDETARIVLLGLDTDTVIIGPDVTCTGGRARFSQSIYHGDPALINRGHITTSGSQSVLVFRIRGFRNEGMLEANDGATLHLGAEPDISDWTNAGTIRVTTASLGLGGAFDVTDIGNIERTGGRVYLFGHLDNVDTSLVLDSSTGSWELAGGEITGGELVLRDGQHLEATSDRGVLRGVAITGDLVFARENALIYIQESFSIDGNIYLTGDAAGILFEDPVEVNDTTFFLESTGRPSFIFSSNSLTLGPNVVIEGGNGSVTANPLINHGIIRSNRPGQSIDVGGRTFENNGIIEAISGGILNAGTNDRPWRNDGIARGVDGELRIVGRLIHTDRHTVLDDSTGSWILAGGTIAGGELTLAQSATLIVDDHDTNQLSSVTINGEVLLPFFESHLLIRSLTLNGTIRLIGERSEVEFIGTQTFPSGTITFEGDPDYGDYRQINVPYRDNVLTLGPDVLVTGSWGDLRGNIVNQGTIQANEQSRANFGIAIFGGQFENEGLIDVLPGGHLRISGSPWFNHGVIRTTDATLVLDGRIATQDLGVIERIGGQVILTAVLDNTDSVLRLDDSTGSWIFMNGWITGGELHQLDDARLVFAAYGINVFSELHVVGDLLLDEREIDITIRGMFSIDGVMAISSADTVIRFLGNQTLLTGEIRSTAPSNAPTRIILEGNAGAVLTVGESFTIRGGAIEITERNPGNNSILLQGAIIADGAIGRMTINVGSFINQGTIEAVNGSQLAITPTNTIFTNTGRISIDPTSSLTITGNYIQTPQGTLAIGAAGPPDAPYSGQLIATGSATLAGTFELAFAKALDPDCGTDFQFISASTVAGQFETLTLPDPPEFHKYPVLYDASGVRLLTTSIADLDNSGTVNILDFLAFLNFYNDSDPIADFNGDGIINTQDFIAYLNAFNHGC